MRDAGRDVTALINGTLATGEGLTVSLSSQSLSLKVILDQAFATYLLGCWDRQEPSLLPEPAGAGG